MELIVSTNGVQEARSTIEDPGVSEWDALRDLDSYVSNSGESVSHRKSLSIPALYQAVSMISGDVAKLPMGCYRRRSDNGRDLFRDHHAFKRINLVGMANEEVNAYKFWRRLMASALLWNNGYAWIDKNLRGEVLGMYNLLPDRTAPTRIGGRLKYLTEVGGRLIALDSNEVFHVEGLSLDGLQGEDLVCLFRDLFGAALAKRKFASKFFKNGLTAGGVLAVPPGANPKTVSKLQAAIKEKYSNTDNAFKTIVLRDGFKWYTTQVDPQKAQMNESTEQDAREVARMFNLAASRLSVEGSSSYNHDEMAERGYYDGTLSHWLIGNRCEANAKLRTQEEIASDEVFIDYNINAIHWADSKTRSEIANSGIANGRFSPNETRAWENLNPYEGGDNFYRPLNLSPVGASEPAGDTESDGLDATRAAATSLASSTIQRAKHRIGIRRERSKSIDDEERARIRDMIAPACVVLGLDVDTTLAELTN